MYQKILRRRQDGTVHGVLSLRDMGQHLTMHSRKGCWLELKENDAGVGSVVS
jgi:hypothetical protein